MNPHLRTRVARFGAPPASASVVVLLVHGRGQDPEYVEEHIVRRLGIDDVAYIAPAAADNTWYPQSFLAPLPDNQPGLQFTMDRMAHLRDEVLDAGVPAERVVWCGFSQGACVLSEFLSISPRRWGGLIALTGGLIGPEGTNWVFDGDFDGMPVYFTTSEADDFVPEWRVRETATRFAAAGARTSVEFHLGRAHEISATEIDRARHLLSTVLINAS